MKERCTDKSGKEQRREGTNAPNGMVSSVWKCILCRVLHFTRNGQKTAPPRSKSLDQNVQKTISYGFVTCQTFGQGSKN